MTARQITSTTELSLDGVTLKFHRTLRMAESRIPKALSPSFGKLPVYKVREFQDLLPVTFDPNAYFLALHDTEAMWISLRFTTPFALLLGVGGVSAITGERIGHNLNPGNYVTVMQPWVDGLGGADGVAYQFVATPHRSGGGLSVTEQLIGVESVSGSIGIEIFHPKPEITLPALPPIRSDHAYGYCEYAVLPAKTLNMGPAIKGGISETGIGKGAAIAQKIYPDPHGFDVWSEQPSTTVEIYLVDAKQFEAATGIDTPLPRSNEGYQGALFKVDDDNLAYVNGSGKFAGLKSAVPAA